VEGGVRLMAPAHSHNHYEERLGAAFHVLSCHPCPCIFLDLRFCADSIPSALASVVSIRAWQHC
jgi:hypothetical protein